MNYESFKLKYLTEGPIWEKSKQIFNKMVERKFPSIQFKKATNEKRMFTIQLSRLFSLTISLCFRHVSKLNSFK